MYIFACTFCTLLQWSGIILTHCRHFGFRFHLWLNNTLVVGHCVIKIINA